MTDTGQVPGEGLPENAGRVEQPGVTAPEAYTYLSDSPAEDEDLLLPGAQGAWGNEIAPPAPEPVVETVHQPGPHETAGRDSGSVDLNGVRLPEQPQQAPAAPRRPLHLGPPMPDLSTSPVRSLADRGPADLPARQPGPPTLGPEYLDVPRARETAAPQVAAAQATGPWAARGTAGAGVGTAEAAAPEAGPVDEAQAVAARVATDAVAHADVSAGTAGGGEQAPAAVPYTDHSTPQVPAPGAPGDTAAGQGYPQADAVASVPAGVAAPEGVPSEGAAVAPEPAEVAGPVAEAPQQADAVQQAEPAAEVPVTAEAGLPGQGAAETVPAPGGTDAAGVAVAEPGPAQDAPVPGAEIVEPVAEVPDGAVAAPEGAQVPQEAPAEDVAVAQAPQVPDAEGVVAQPRPETEPETETVIAVAEAREAQDTAAEQAQAPEAVAEAGQDAVQAPVVDAAVPRPAGDLAAGAPGGEPQGGPEAGAAPGTDVPQAAPVAETPVPEPVQAPEVPGTTPLPDAVAAQGAQAPETPAPEPIPAPEAVLAPEAALAPEPTHAPEAALAPEAVAPEAPAPDAPDTPVPAAAPAAGNETTVASPEPEAPAPAADASADHAVADPSAVPAPAPAEPETPAPADAEPETPAPADAVQGPQQTSAHATPLPGTLPLTPEADQPLGQFVPVDGTVPTAPHLAPTPPQGVTVPEDGTAPADAVPAAPDADVDVPQNADDLDTQGAGVEPAGTAGPAAPGYADAEREAVLKVMRERRDIRNGFRSDPIPHEVLLRVLEAAHTAPSVGHSQPWDFVVIRSAETRRRMHELAMRQREAYAKSLPKGRAKQFKELKIEAILDTPVNIVVTADPTRGGRHTLGRHTQPQMAPYSSALAVENLWLAARAEGLGVGWVSFFDEREMVRALELPDHLEVVAYLCVGYVDEFPDEPELMQAGWSKRRPLSWVVHEETYGRRALPGEDPHDLLAETVAQIRPLDAKALGEAWERQKRMTKPAGALGMLEIISAQLSGLSRQCPPPIPEPAAVAVFAGDHGVHAQGVTPWPQEVTAQMVANFLGGGAVCNAFAAQVGAEVCVVDVGVSSDLPATPGLLPRKIRAGTSDMTTGPAMTREEAKQAIEVGIETARDLVAAGNKALLTGEMGIANTTASAALISVFTGADPADVTGRGTGINDETLVRKTDVVRRALELHRPDPADPLGVLAAVGGFEHAAMVGLLLGGASLRTPVILDGVSAGAAALVARAIAPEVLAACIAGHRSAEPGHVAALNKLGLRPLVDLDLRLGEGTGALLALPLVQSTARAMHEVATFDSAGVTEK
ncbi:nicotinate-nucleotide--dimethylbenzimidazole phosphoribosyltransferase [Streptomyces sp. CNZ748]|uniref:nicotinate-nucleotide--dimethylbenzimidazole phosphoribosyltransferase n=1 Tax=Streptomyces sp. CNZ748 TaxID=2885160 RepID=UPI001E604298|nr:nicotinate-nucleotide--dimethylbenzimidazole phosphoribosyltransferase [Streptomyces sp. CNZ748]